MQTKFSEDVIPLSDLKVNPGKIVGRAQENHRPILLTSRGRGVAVMQGLEDFERTADELAFVKAVAKGLAEARDHDTVSLEDAKQALGIE
ncbi:type II toxin-antitoxin system Phd/YefM family antitoxin [Maribrevibacterium harenarium]|uniref:Antitoxin n=1 Tax=Maribrevibacterium harenarium TaxID=2589817 RepID=A0A501X4C4_9GAMM|nr:type II toxin-antitoxin system Phd/YefM family antitoxin [Maribrevibacterium harenarium]TPE55289.1 type II toxin-antitoxin system Phd/YefM family antitoxin [Maribrevibacterium harenarium]